MENSSQQKSNNQLSINNQSPDKLLNPNTDRDLESEGGFNLDELPVDQFNNEDDKFNKVMSTNDHGGLLASIGLKNVNANLLEGNEEDDEDNYADEFDDDFADHQDLDGLADDKLKLNNKLPDLSSLPNNKNDIFDTSGTKDHAKKKNDFLDDDSDIGGDNYDFDMQNSDEEDGFDMSDKKANKDH